MAVDFGRLLAAGLGGFSDSYAGTDISGTLQSAFDKRDKKRDDAERARELMLMLETGVEERQGKRDKLSETVDLYNSNFTATQPQGTLADGSVLEPIKLDPGQNMFETNLDVLRGIDTAAAQENMFGMTDRAISNISTIANKLEPEDQISLFSNIFSQIPNKEISDMYTERGNQRAYERADKVRLNEREQNLATTIAKEERKLATKLAQEARDAKNAALKATTIRPLTEADMKEYDVDPNSSWLGEFDKDGKLVKNPTKFDPTILRQKIDFATKFPEVYDTQTGKLDPDKLKLLSSEDAQLGSILFKDKDDRTNDLMAIVFESLITKNK